MKIYLIGGVTYSRDMYDYFKRTATYLRSCGHEVIVPLLYPETEADSTTRQAIRSHYHWAIRNADVVYVDYNDVSYRSYNRLAELSYAKSIETKIIISMRRDDTTSFWNFLVWMADIVFKNHNDAMSYLYSIKE